MEHELLTRIREFSRRGLIWHASHEETDKLNDYIKSHPHYHSVSAALQQVLKLRGLYNFTGSREHQLYEQECNRLRAAILNHPLTNSLFKSWSDEVYSQLVLHFFNEAPESFIKEVIDYDSLSKIKHNNLADEDLSVLKFLEIERDVRLAIRSIPYGFGYAERIYNAIRTGSQNNLPYMTIRLNTIYDVLTVYNPDNIPVFPEDISEALFFGIKNFRVLQDFATRRYATWHMKTSLLVLTFPSSASCFRSVFPAPDAAIVDVFQEHGEVVKLAAAILASFYEMGFPDHIAQDLILPIIHGLLKEESDNMKTSLDASLRRWLWGVGMALSEGGFSLPSSVAYGLSAFRKWLEAYLLPFGFISMITSLISHTGIAIYNALDKLFEIVFDIIKPLLGESYDTAVEYFYLNRLFLSQLLPEARRRPKAVWALLFKSDMLKLTPAEKFLAGCNLMALPETNQDYMVWAEKRLKAIQALGVELETTPDIPIRGFHLPKEPYVASEEHAKLAPLMPDKVKINDTASEFTERLINMGVPRGIDGLWFGTPDALAASISRYAISIPPVEDIVRTVSLRAAHALADKYPGMYKDAKTITPMYALNKVKLNKFSPGLPYIPRYRSRLDLEKVGIWAATAREAERLLREGTHPGEFAHAFGKRQVVLLDKLLADSSKLRTVTASTLLSNVMQYVNTVEVTRRMPPLDAFVMNARPRTEGGFRDFYDVLQKRSFVFAADITKFDSQLIPTMVDAVTELRCIGYDGSLVKDIATSQIRASYHALKYANIIDLSTGRSFPKIKGFLTGQGNTSVDNRDAFRIVILTAWSLVTGEPPEKFWDTNDLGNAGDDDAIGTDTPDIWPKILETIKTRFGMEVRLENEGFENLSLVGLTVSGVPQHSIKYYKVLGHPVPNYAIRADMKALLSKRTEWTNNIAGSFSDIKFLMGHIDGIIGTAYQTAHLNEIYELLGDQYITEISQVLLRFYKNIVIDKIRDETNRPIEFFIHLGTERDRYKGATDNIRKWLKQHRFPKYADIMRIWLKPVDIVQSKMQKDYKKLLSWQAPIPHSDRILFGIWNLRQTMLSIPNHVARAMPEFRGADPTFALRNPDYVIEKFVWLSLYHKLGKKIPPSQLFKVRLRENPYGSACDPLGFLLWLSNGEHMEQLVKNDLEDYRAQMVYITIAYYFFENITKFFSNIPGFAILYHLYALSTRDINRLYSFLNYIYMISEGASSNIISNMMPPDPYAWMKIASVVTTYVLPRKFYRVTLPGLRHIVRVLPLMVEIWAASDAFVNPRPYRTLYNQMDIPAHWGDLAGQLSPHLLNPNDMNTILVIAKTGTGKSTAFVGSLMYNSLVTGTIWILCPTIISRDIYENRFIPNGMFQILSQGIVNKPECRVKVLTYGHARNRIPIEARPEDVIIFDEIHKADVDMLHVWFICEGYKRIMITATPGTPFMPVPDLRFDLGIERRFTVQVDVLNLDIADIISHIISIDINLFSRALIICPTLNRVDFVRQTLDRVSIQSSALSSLEPEPSPIGTLVATTIVDQAVTIEPPPSCLIDLGESLVIDYNFLSLIPTATAKIVPSSRATFEQRLGRAGRSGDSRAFVTEIAGTGEPEKVRLTPFNLLNDKSYAERLCAWYKVSVAIDEVNKRDDIFRYFRMAPDFEYTVQDPHTIALAFYILARHSDYSIGENLYLEWLQLKQVRSEHEIINVILDATMELGLGDPLLGSYNHALDAINAGSFGVQVGGHFHPTGSLAIIDRAVTYSGNLHTEHLKDHELFKSVFVLDARQTHYWTTFEAITKANLNAEVFNYTPVFTDIVLIPFERRDYTHTQQNVFALPVVALLSAYRTQYVSQNLRRKSFLVRIEINSNQQNPIYDDVIVVLTRTDLDIFVMRPFDYTLYATKTSISEITLFLLLASAHQDDEILVFGDPSTDILKVAKDLSKPGFLTNKNFEWAIVSPGYVRTFVHFLYCMYHGDKDFEVISSIPKRVVLDGPNDNYEPQPSEIPVYISEYGLKGIPR